MTIPPDYRYEIINGIRCRVNTETGEVVYKDGRYRTPIDIHSITSREIYDEVVKEARGKSKWRLWIGDLALDLAIEKEISISSFSIFCALGREVGFNNMVYTTSKEIQEKTKYNRDTVSRGLTDLKNLGLIREADWVKERGGRLFFLNPLYFFMGYYPYRDQLLKKWMEESNSVLKEN